MTEEVFRRLTTRASTTGTVLVRNVVLLEELGIDQSTLSTELAELERSKRIEVLVPGSFLVIKLRKWSGLDASTASQTQEIRRERSVVWKEVPVSSAAATATQLRDGGVGEGDILLREVLDVLGPDADPQEFALILAGLSPVLVRRCLKRVLATRAIRVSRAALFRSLLHRLH